MNKWLIIGTTVGYALLLFYIAWWAERRAGKGKSLVNNPWVYALSLAVYCTAWTYFGSVGRAAQEGIDFLSIYIGPTLMAPLWWIILRKIIRICKTQNITTLSDFISSRYGKSVTLGWVVSLICLLAVIPYIALQLKAISWGLNILIEQTQPAAGLPIYRDLTFYITLAIALFTILFGARHFDVTQRHEGMVTAIAFESLVKLIAFLTIGLYVCFVIFDSPAAIFRQAAALPELEKLFVLDGETGLSNWFYISFLSMLAIILLPRQFQMAVVENSNERHLDKAMWLFPLYLLVINLFVLPIAFGGRLSFIGQSVDPDTYVMSLPMAQGHDSLALLAYLGGYSAATSMIIVSVAALSIMLNNSLSMPLLLRISSLNKRFQQQASKIGLQSRRLNIVLILLLAYGYYKYVAELLPLASIGLISFVGVAQLAPALLGGIFWKAGNRKGALSGLILGFFVWFYTLVIPTMVTANILPESLMQEGPFGISWLHPYQFLGMQGLEPLVHGLFWSLLLNILAYAVVSLQSQGNSREQNSAEVFVDIFKYSSFVEQSIVWKGKAYLADIRSMLSRILGKEKTEQALLSFSRKYQIDLQNDQEADARLINYTEQLLAGALGGASARIMVASITKMEEEISLEEVYAILRETQHLVSINRELKQKSEALRQATEQLQASNRKLTELDALKDEFISTVTHEMRTPLTSIRAFSEILQDSPELSDEERNHFLDTIIRETQRMDRLINQVLDLERFDSGKQKLQLELLKLPQVLQEAMASMQQVAQEKGIHLQADISQSLPEIQADRDRLLQVILNLLSNALKFARKEVILSAYYLDGDIKVNVWDDGKGIAEENQPYIFDKFYQIRHQTSKKPIGSGLGLAISKKIIEHHGGKIWVESTVEKETKFSFLLPVVKEQRLSPPHEQETESAGSG